MYFIAFLVRFNAFEKKRKSKKKEFGKPSYDGDTRSNN